MNYFLNRLSLIAITIVLALLYYFLFTPAVYTQEVITTTSSAQALASPNAMSMSQEDTVFGAINPTTWDWWLRMLSALFLSAIGAWAIYRVFCYVTEMQNRYYDVTRDLASRGQTTRAVVISASLPNPAMLSAAAAAGTTETLIPTPKKLTVKGPSTVTVNNESADFTAFFVQDDTEVPVDDTVTWQVMPESAASLNRAKGSVIRLTAKQLGALDLLVKTADPAAAAGSTEIHFPVAVIAPPSIDISLPFIGEGWGTIVLAILFGIIIAILGLSRVLSTALVGTLLGALLVHL